MTSLPLSQQSQATLRPHRIKIALVHPQIAPNTGNIGRLCVATGTELHLIRPLGFVLSDRNLRRSGLDYWERLNCTLHDDTETFLKTLGSEANLWMFDSSGEVDLWQADFRDGDWLVFGSESRGLNTSLLQRDPARTIRIPQVIDERCLNLATAAGIALYEALRQVSMKR